jgi:hypothetical protein
MVRAVDHDDITVFDQMMGGVRFQEKSVIKDSGGHIEARTRIW